MKKNKMLAWMMLLGILFASQSPIFAGDNPFISKEAPKKRVVSIRYPVFIQKMLSKIVPLQHRLNKALVAFTREIKETRSKKSLSIVIVIAFIYGVIHALGPGHGKTITWSYFLSKQANIKKGIIVGNAIAFLHAGSALAIVLSLQFVARQAVLTSFEEVSRTIQLVSYALIAMIGLFLLIQTCTNLRRKKNRPENSLSYEDAEPKNMIPVAIAVGLIPCPGAVIILLFSSAMGVLKLGVLLTLMMALGMGVTISSVAVLTIVAKRGILKFVSGKPEVIAGFQAATGIAGSAFIFLLGLFLFLGRL
jgi:ABC-type nickel/cobalt efflux system permease component RcnA